MWYNKRKRLLYLYVRAHTFAPRVSGNYTITAGYGIAGYGIIKAIMYKDRPTTLYDIKVLKSVLSRALFLDSEA